MLRLMPCKGAGSYLWVSPAACHHPPALPGRWEGMGWGWVSRGQQHYLVSFCTLPMQTNFCHDPSDSSWQSAPAADRPGGSASLSTLARMKICCKKTPSELVEGEQEGLKDHSDADRFGIAVGSPCLQPKDSQRPKPADSTSQTMLVCRGF